jgi:hypothetical protein
MGTSKPSVVETNVSQSAGSKASLAEVGLMAPSHERGFQKSSRALALSACSSRLFISTRRVESGNRGFVFLWQKLALLLEERAGVALTQDLEGRPMLGELLRDTLLGMDDGLRGLLVLLVLRAGGR